MLSGVAEASLDGLAPVADIKSMAIGSDHSGVALKGEAARPPAAARAAACSMSAPTDPSRWIIPTSPRRSRGWWRAKKWMPAIVIDGAGLGSAIAANKIDGVRAAMCTDKTLARYAREHNGANVLALGATLLSRRGREGDRRHVARRRRWARRATSAGWRRFARWRRCSDATIGGVIELILEELARAGAVAPARCALPWLYVRVLSGSRAAA